MPPNYHKIYSSDNNSAYANFERSINSVDNNSCNDTQSQIDDHQTPKKRTTSITFHSSANYGSGGLDVSDTSRLSSSARAKSKRRSSIFTGRRPSSRRRLEHDSSPEDRHMQHLTMKKVGFCSFVIVCVDGERGGDKERVIGGINVEIGASCNCAHDMLMGIVFLCISYALF